MLKLTLSASLLSLLPESDRAEVGNRHTLSVDAGSWPEAVTQLQNRFPRLAAHVLDPSGRVKRGFVVAVNDRITSVNEQPPEISPGDDIFLFTQIAGG
jgi:hypothetical protein